MVRERIKLEVYVDLDPMPGTFHSKESAQNVVAQILRDRISHYNPTVSQSAPEEPDDVSSLYYVVLDGGSTGFTFRGFANAFQWGQERVAANLNQYFEVKRVTKSVEVVYGYL